MVTSDREHEPSRHTAAWRESVEDGIHVHWTPVHYRNEMNAAMRIISFLKFAIRAMSKATQLKGDIVFATSSPLTIAFPAIWAARRSRIPMVFEVRDLWPAVPIAMGVLRNPLARWAALRLEKLAYSHSERIVALAPGMKDHIVEKGVPEELVSVIPNGSDIAFFTNREDGAMAIRAKTPWLGKRILIVYCGAIGQVNGVDYLVRIAAEVAKVDSEVRFAVIGTGRLEEQVRESAKTSGVLDQNFFMVGGLAKEDAATWICAADMVIALITGPEILWRHATQNKFFDALAAGKPVANNFVGWQSEIAVEEKAGLILDADDVTTAARQLLDRLKDNIWMKEAAANAAALGASRFNRDYHAEQLNAVLNEARDGYHWRRNRTVSVSTSKPPARNEHD